MWALGLTVGWAAACSDAPSPLSEERRTQVAALGHSAAQSLAQTLVGNLTRAIDEGGSAQAVEFCSLEAVALTDAAVFAAGQGLDLKRVSFRVRNPDNAPDELEAEALRHFEAELARGAPLPDGFVQPVEGGGFRYYQPLLVGEFCLQCHGTEDRISPEVRDVLASRYPDDHAVGYSAGDFRGLIRVAIPADAVAP